MSPSPQLTTQPQTALNGLSLNDWATRCLNIPGVQVQCWQRENAIDILCEGEVCPEVSTVIDQLTERLKTTPLQTLLPPGSPNILMVCVHGRVTGSKRPNWTVRLNPHQPDTAAPPAEIDRPLPPSRKISEILPPDRDWMAARQGNPKAIADYLSQTLKSWGLGVKVIVKIETLEKATAETTDRTTDRIQPSNRANPWTPTNLNDHTQPESNQPLGKRGSRGIKPHRYQKRLWVVCQSAYSPEPLSIAPPLGTHLRQLDLQGFKDAVILGQVSGEKQPEWILRVDLTPAKEMLENWARWGDVQAITKLLHQRLIETLPGTFAEDLQVSGVLKESTLHIFFSDPEFAIESAAYGPDSNTLSKETMKAAIAPLLETISPQNIFGITIYGLRGDRSTAIDMNAAPLWVDWLDLPASRHASLAPSTLELARHGDLDALTFLLDRLLNPDIEDKLNTGGIRIAIRHKADLLHIMVDAATCPPRGLGGKVAKFIASLNMPQIGGVRVYGRRSGQKNSSWRYGMDFQSRESMASDTTPEFKVSEPASVIGSPDLLPQPGNLVIRPDVNSEDLQACLTKLPTTKLRKKKEESSSWLKQGLMVSGLVIPASSAAPNNNLTGAKVTLIWGLLGLLFTLQADWFLAELVQLRQYKLEHSKLEQNTAVSTDSPATTMVNSLDPNLANSEWSTLDDDDEVFNGSGFTQPLNSGTESFNRISRKTFKYPSFNSQQMDEQLAVYAQYVANYGVPDVLIVGSSRALRGIDPAVLREGLANRYANLRIFNFGVNGATAQVVDLVIRQLLGEQQLPRLIVWADGARAFNSGRSDRTFEGMVKSPGYQELKLGLRPQIFAPESEPDNGLASLTITLAEQAKKGFSVADGYQQLDKWFNEQLGSFSASYAQRDELNQWFSDGLRNSISERSQSLLSDPDSCLSLLPSCHRSQQEREDSRLNSLDSMTTQDPKSATNFNGFLPIELHFDPVTYYEQYALVSGDYDADYESFNLAGEQTAAMINLLTFIQQHQVSLVFVNMPLTEDYLDPIRLEHERTFQKYMLGLALQYGFIFRDFSQEWPTEHHYFSDPSHLNYLGAQRVSERLAQDPLIPWPNPESK